MNKKAWGEANRIFCSLSQERFLRKERARRRRGQGFEVISFPEKEKEREGEFCRFQRHKNQGRIILLFQQFQQGKQDVFQGRICSFDGRFFQHVFRGDFCRILKKKFEKKKIMSVQPYGIRTVRTSIQHVFRGRLCAKFLLGCFSGTWFEKNKF